MAAALVVVVVVVTLVTLGVGLLGASRTRKDRPSLKSYEHQQAKTTVTSSSTPMGSDSTSARTMASKTDAVPKKTVCVVDPDESHMRARDSTQAPANSAAFGHGDDADVEDRPSLVKRVCWLLWQLTGIPLLTGLSSDRHPKDSMGNTAAPTHLLLNQLTVSTTVLPAAEVETTRDSKTGAVPDDDQQVWSDDASSERDDTSEDEAEEEQDIFSAELPAPVMLDGLEFYAAVASVSLATVTHAVDIALFRATTIVLRERRKAQEDATIHAIETLYPDIMCLPPNANVCYAGPLSMTKSIAKTTTRAAMSPTATSQLETRFLKAA